jgi:heme-degrading monooxygenase HmoA
LPTECRVIRLFRFQPVRMAFDTILRREMVPALLDMPGLLELYAGRQGPAELGPRLVATLWADGEAMSAGVGDSLERSAFFPEYLDETQDRTLEILPLSFGYRFAGAGRSAILRLVSGSVKPGELDRYVDQARAGTLADAAAGRGPIALYLAKRIDERFATLSVWRDWPTLQEATGGAIDRPRATRHAALLDSWSVEHYEGILDDPVRPERS